MATFNLQSGFYSVALQEIENPHLMSASNPSMQSLHAGNMAHMHNMYSYYSETQAVLIPSCYIYMQQYCSMYSKAWLFSLTAQCMRTIPVLGWELSSSELMYHLLNSCVSLNTVTDGLLEFMWSVRFTCALLYSIVQRTALLSCWRCMWHVIRRSEQL